MKTRGMSPPPARPNAPPTGVEPLSRVFGLDRGTAIDRYYIESFLEQHQADIRGRVLEIGDAAYTNRFGGAKVNARDVLHATEGNPKATIIGDLATGRGLPIGAYDCIILTQTLGCIFDVRAAVATTCRALKPSGVALATLPGISQISRYDMERWGDFWRFTSLSARRLFEEAFGPGNATVVAHGNVAIASAFLYGRCLEEMQPGQLDIHDPDYEMLITVRARKTRP